VKISKIDNLLNIKNSYCMYSEPKYSQQLRNRIADITLDRSHFYTADIDGTPIDIFASKAEFIKVCKVGLDLKPKWEVIFSDGGAPYFPMSLRTTKGDGVMICGGNMRLVGSYVRGSSFILKFDKDGNLIKTVGINDKELFHTKSYPNPTSSSFRIQTNGVSFDHVKLYTLDGKEVLSQDSDGTTSSIEFDLSSLPASIYIYNIYNNVGKLLSSGKVVKE
jgi:hypothetical protein